jgi:dephospho-CoA kinase
MTGNRDDREAEATLNVALTGNIAAGKSAVAQLFRGWGATVLDADAIVREVQAPGGAVMERIAQRFGQAVVLPDGTLDRSAVRRIVMGDAAAREALERIVHPAVYARRAELAREAEARGDRIVVSDIPLLFETGHAEGFDAVVLVDAAEPVRLRRLVEQRGLTDAEALAMIRAQMPASAKRERSDYVIDNDGDRAALERAASEVWRALVARA